MSDPKFTPGPWSITPHNGWLQIDAGDDAVATTHYCYGPKYRASAYLIAAAPDLYAALQVAEGAYGDSTWETVEAMERAMPQIR